MLLCFKGLHFIDFERIFIHEINIHKSISILLDVG